VSRLSLVTVLEQLGLAAALVGILCGMRGWWPETVGCGTLVIVCTVLAAVWDPPRHEGPNSGRRIRED
jgi:hypothetical protein